MRIAIPHDFLAEGIIGQNHQEIFDRPEGWSEYYGWMSIPISDLNKIFKPLIPFFINAEEDGAEITNSCAVLAFYSLSLRYFTQNKQPEHRDDPHIVWDYKFKKVSSDTHIPLKHKPFTVLTVADKEGKIEKNIIYGPSGESLYCIDFNTPDESSPTQLRILVPGTLQEDNNEKNSCTSRSIPWVWSAVSFDEQSEIPQFKSPEMFRLPYEVITVNSDPTHVNPTFTLINSARSTLAFLTISDLFESAQIREEMRLKKVKKQEESSFYGTVKSYAPYLAVAGLFLAGHKILQKFDGYEKLSELVYKQFSK